MYSVSLLMDGTNVFRFQYKIARTSFLLMKKTINRFKFFFVFRESGETLFGLCSKYITGLPNTFIYGTYGWNSQTPSNSRRRFQRIEFTRFLLFYRQCRVRREIINFSNHCFIRRTFALSVCFSNKIRFFNHSRVFFIVVSFTKVLRSRHFHFDENIIIRKLQYYTYNV